MSKKNISKFGLKLTQTEEIENLLGEVNGRAEQWTINNVSTVEKAAKDAESQLDDVCLPKTCRVGATAKVWGYAPDRKGYSYGVTSTEIHFRRFAEGWRVMSIDRVKLYPCDSRARKVKVALTGDQIDRVTKITLERFDRQPEKLAA